MAVGARIAASSQQPHVFAFFAFHSFIRGEVLRHADRRETSDVALGSPRSGDLGTD